MTIRIPKRFLFVLLVVIVLAGVGIGGYALGRHSRAGLASQLSRLQRRDASTAADLVVHERNTIQQLLNLCREVVRLHPAFGAFDASTCPRQIPAVPLGSQPLLEHDTETFNAIAIICDYVLQIEGSQETFSGQRTNCAQGYKLLPSSGLSNASLP